jgi:hypothetical protein
MKGNQEVSPSSPPGLPGKVFFIRDDAVVSQRWGIA